MRHLSFTKHRNYQKGSRCDFEEKSPAAYKKTDLPRRCGWAVDILSSPKRLISTAAECVHIFFCGVCVCLCACLVKFELSEATKCQTETVLMTNSRTDKVKLHIFTIIFNLFFYNVIKIPIKYKFAYIVACNAPLSFSKQSGLFAFKKHLEIVVGQEALTWFESITSHKRFKVVLK